MSQRILIAVCLICAVQPVYAAGRGYLGVWFGPLSTSENAVRTGVVVNKVFAGSAAQKAGLKPGEIVTQIDGVSARDPETAVALVAENGAGERIRLTVIDRSGGQTHRSQVFATLAANPTDEFASIMTAKPLGAMPRSCATPRSASSAGMKSRPCPADGGPHD